MWHSILITGGLWLVVGLIVTCVDRKKLEEVLSEQPLGGHPLYDTAFWVLAIIFGPYELGQRAWHWCQALFSKGEEEENES